MKKLFGFKSKNPITNLLAIFYYVACFYVLYLVITTKVIVECSRYDAILFRVEMIVIFLWLSSPIVLMSDSPYHDYLPFFSKNTMFSNLYGIVVFSLFFFFLLLTIHGLHTSEYQILFQDYVEVTFEQFYEYGSSN